MPVDKEVLLRYILIDARLRRVPQPSIEDLKKFLEDEFAEIKNSKVSLSRETIKKDIKSIRRIFSAPVDYSFQNNRYFYQVKNYTLLKLPENTLNALLNNLKLQFLLGKKLNTASFIYFESETQIVGWENLPVIAKCISEKKVLCFSYKSIKSKRSHEYHLHPYVLKAYQNYWYLVGKKEGEKDIRTFALHSIIGKPVVTEKDAVLDPSFDAAAFLKGSIDSSS